MRINTIQSLRLRHCHSPSPPQKHFNKQIVVILGATGTGKTRLSIDLSHHFLGEVVNSDKIQLYSGLDITTNKVPVEERRSVPHHLLGTVLACTGFISPEKYSQMADETISSILKRNKLPVIAGGSNSLINALLSDKESNFNQNRATHDPFSAKETNYNRPKLRYSCHMLWVDVEEEILMKYLDKRVDEMVKIGMIEELAEYFKKEKKERDLHVGLNMAIGVPELEHYFTGTKSLNEALDEIKENTRELAMVQVRKIERLKNECKWPIKRVDVTQIVKAKLRGDKPDMWDLHVLRPCAESLREFLLNREVEDEVGFAFNAWTGRLLRVGFRGGKPDPKYLIPDPSGTRKYKKVKQTEPPDPNPKF